jgi:hypothetical protein
VNKNRLTDSTSKHVYALAMVLLLVTACGGGKHKATQDQPNQSSSIQKSSAQNSSGQNSSAQNSSSQNSSSQSSAASLLTGVFVDGMVMGLHYQTATQSGLTNAKSEFQYKAGETVTFAVGGITLGSALGSAKISPFDLLKTTAPTTETGLRAEFRDSDDISNFDRVFNIAFFLASLDTNADLNDGIDLTGWQTKLATASLSFDAPLTKFSADKFRRLAATYDINRNLLPGDALAYLYHALAIIVPGNLLTQTKIYIGKNASLGNMADLKETKTYTYDSSGRLVSSKSDKNLDGTFDTVNSTTYDSKGRIASTLSTYDNNFDGTIDQTTSTLFTYSTGGNLLTRVRETVLAASKSRSATTFTFDSQGNLRTETTIVDKGVINSVTSKTSVLNTYNSTGDQVLHVVDKDSNGDGVYDERVSTALTYDTQGNLSKSAQTTHLVAGGTPDSSYIETYAYDNQGKATTLTVEDDSDVSDTSIPHLTYTYTYAANGKVANLKALNDPDGDGTANEAASFTFTYNSSDNEIKSVLEKDTNLDGIPDSKNTTATTYTSSGDLLTSVKDTDTNADSNIDSKEITSVSYDAAGAGNETSQLYQKDDTNDGIIDSATRTDSTYTNANNVLLYWVSKAFKLGK